MVSLTKAARHNWAHWLWFIPIVAFLYLDLEWDSAGFTEAAAPAYYQARVVFERGGPGAQRRVMEAYRDGKITEAEYSETVLPAYLRVFREGDEPFPAAERAKPIEQLRAELGVTTRGGTAARQAWGQ